MNVKIANLLVAFASVFLITFTLQAQEETPVIETPDPARLDVNLDEDRTLNYDHPGYGIFAKDSIQVTPKIAPVLFTKPGKADTHKNTRKENDDEDALSFNILYYMFQKFKMSDLIDQ